VFNSFKTHKSEDKLSAMVSFSSGSDNTGKKIRIISECFSFFFAIGGFIPEIVQLVWLCNLSHFDTGLFAKVEEGCKDVIICLLMRYLLLFE
jgi:hypothetical protein